MIEREGNSYVTCYRKEKDNKAGYLKAVLLAVFFLFVFDSTISVQADEIRVAVASNFSMAAQEIGELFTESTGHIVLSSFGSSGQLYAQIAQGAPFDVFLSADENFPKRLVSEGYGMASSVITYAIGRLVLFSADPKQPTAYSTLQRNNFASIAIANPALSPYGSAAIQVLKRADVVEHFQTKLIHGSNVTQAYQFVITKNAEVGLVALAQVMGHNNGSRWIIPGNLHSPIVQNAVLLQSGADNKGAREFITFLQSPQVSVVKMRYGYE